VNWIAIGVTLKLAMLTALALVVIGLPVAYWVSFSRWRWKFLVESVVALPLVLPPTVLGFYILVAIGPHSPFGRFYADLAGHPLPFTFEGLLIASVLYSLPFAVQPFAAAFDQVDRRLIEASWTLGEFGVVLMVGGNIEGVTRTVSIDIYDEVQALDYAGAAQTAVFLLIVSYLILLSVYAMNRKVWAVWPQK
jgi:molybdate transport system permease protein